MFENIMLMLTTVRDWISFGFFDSTRLLQNKSWIRGDMIRLWWLRDPFPLRNPSSFFRPHARFHTEHIMFVRKFGYIAGFRQTVSNPANGYLDGLGGLNFVPISYFSPMFSFNFTFYIPSKTERGWFEQLLLPLFLLDREIEMLRQCDKELRLEGSHQSENFNNALRTSRAMHISNWFAVIPSRSFIYTKKSTCISHYLNPCLAKYSEREMRDMLRMQQMQLERTKSYMTPELRSFLADSLEREEVLSNRRRSSNWW